MRASLKWVVMVALAVGMNVTVLAQMYGPQDPPPLGVTFTYTGTLNDGDIARAGGKTFYYSNLLLANYTDAYWGAIADQVLISLDGCVYTGDEIMSYSASLSDLPNGLVAWTGQTSINLVNPPSNQTVYTRFTMSITEDGVTTIPLIDPGFDCPSSIAAGHDLWESARDGDIFPPTFDFSADASPIPADFFGPGSDPFDGQINLTGDPFQTTPSGDFGLADAIVERPAPTAIPDPLSPPQPIAIELVALSLISSQPITVTYNGGQNPEEWDVKVCLSEIASSPGTMDISSDCCEGGTFTAHLDIMPRFTFTLVSDPRVSILDFHWAGYPAVPWTYLGKWLAELSPPDIPGPVQVDHDCYAGTTDIVVGPSPRLLVTGGTGTPWFGEPCFSLGLDPNIGGLVQMTTSGMSFQAYLLYEASYSQTSGFQPAYDFYDAEQTTDGNACTSFDYGWYWNNAPPSLTRNNPLGLIEAGTGTIINTLLEATDIESPVSDITFTVGPDQGMAPQHGTLYRGGVPLSESSTFTQEDVDNLLVTYEHDGGETVTDGFVFSVQDGDGALASDGPYTLYNFSIIITPIDDPPVANDAGYAVSVGTTLNESFTADDPDSPVLTYNITSNGTLGTATLLDVNTGAFEYVPLPATVGQDFLQFTAYDGVTLSNTGTVTIDIVNIPPVANDAGYTISIGVTLNESFTADDPDSPVLTYNITSNGTLGTATLLDVNTGAFEYVPLPATTGQDFLQFTAFDGMFLSNTGTVTIDIVNIPPTAVNDAGTTNEGVPLNGTVSATDPDSPMLTYAIHTDGAKGTAIVTDANTGAFTYTPDADAIGEDVFLFTAYDGYDYSAPGSFTVTIHPDIDKGDVLIADANAGLLLCDPTTAQLALISAGGLIDNIRRVDVELDGKVLVMDQSEGLIRVDLTDGSQTLVSAGSNFDMVGLGPFGIAVEAAGTIIVADVTNGVVRVDPTTGVVTTLSSGGVLGMAVGVALAPNGDIYVTDGSVMVGGTSKVLRIDPVLGLQTVISVGDNLLVPLDIVIEASGDLVVSDAGSYMSLPDLLIRIDATTGIQTVISAGGSMAMCTGLALNQDGNIYTASANNSSLLEIDAVSGVQTTVVSGSGLVEPWGLHMIPVTCCVDRVGDANGLGGDEPTIGDVSTLIDAKFITGTCEGILDCFTEADVNQSGLSAADCDDITIGDISTLIDYLFITGESLGLPECL